MKKRLFIGTLSLVFLSIFGSSCDSGYSEHYYIRNSLAEPIEYSILLENGDKRHVVVILPDESTEVFESSGIGGSDFAFNSEISSNFFDLPFGKHSITFADSTCLTWTVNPESDQCRNKHPLKKEYWNIFKSINNKRNPQYWIEYTVDEEDYRNALAQSGL